MQFTQPTIIRSKRKLGHLHRQSPRSSLTLGRACKFPCRVPGVSRQCAIITVSHIDSAGTQNTRTAQSNSQNSHTHLRRAPFLEMYCGGRSWSRLVARNRGARYNSASASASPYPLNLMSSAIYPKYRSRVACSGGRRRRPRSKAAAMAISGGGHSNEHSVISGLARVHFGDVRNCQCRSPRNALKLQYWCKI